MSEATMVDPNQPEKAAAPEEQFKKDALGDIFAMHIGAACCQEHGMPDAHWHVGVEMRGPTSEQDHFTLGVDGNWIWAPRRPTLWIT